MAYLLMGYDVENYLDPYLKKNLNWEVTSRFLHKMRRVHEELNAPCTLFICGRLLEEKRIRKTLQDLAQSELFDLEQHTYSHQRLKAVIQSEGERTILFDGSSLETIKEEIIRTNKLFEEKLGIRCEGICGPYGYYQGLMDRPDILDVLHKTGIRFTRTSMRGKNHWEPLSIYIQPFTYEPQGFPDILEIPSQGWQDILYLRTHGWDKRKGLLEYNKKTVDQIAEKNLVWSACQHDWTSCEKDPEMSYTRALLEYARLRGVTVATHKSYYQRIMGVSPSDTEEGKRLILSNHYTK